MPNTVFPDSKDEQLFRQLLEWAQLTDHSYWRNIAPEDKARIVTAVEEIATLPDVQAEQGAAPQFVLMGKYVFNLRPLAVPAVIAILVEITVAVIPVAASPLLPVLDALHFAKELHEGYRKLKPDEIEVFNAVAALYAKAKRNPVVTDPHAHPTKTGVRMWLVEQGYQVPANLDAIFVSLEKKGAIEATPLPGGESLYSLTFLGKKREHE
jgi:hypothetical protein